MEKKSHKCSHKQQLKIKRPSKMNFFFHFLGHAETKKSEFEITAHEMV